MNAELDQYIRHHITPATPPLDDIDRESNLHLINGRMCSGHIQGRIIKMLTEMISPKRALELGTFSGYSGLCIAEGLPEGGELHTVEANDELEEIILSNFARSPYGDRITLHIGDAEEVMKNQLADTRFDLIFIDADKRRYPAYYPLAKSLLSPRGYIIADNTLWDGHVADPTHASDPQTRGVMQFNDLVAADPDVEVVILPVRDGLTIIHKKTV